MAEEQKPMDVPAVLEAMNHALSHLFRAALQYTVISGSLFGLEFVALGAELRSYGEAELADARLVVEKIASLGGRPTTYTNPFDWDGEPAKAVELVVAAEQDAIDALREVIPHSGTEGRSEALEHLVEHIILRKQNQLDFLFRTRRAPNST